MTVMFDPYTGRPRHPSDIAGDPDGLLIVEKLSAPLLAAAQTPAQRKAAERQRHNAAGRTEVRGIYAHPDDHPPIKAEAERLKRKRDGSK